MIDYRKFLKLENKVKYRLLCNNCSNLNSYLCKVGEQKPHKQRIKITEYETAI